MEKLRPGGPWVLTAITPDGATTTFTARTTDQVNKFVAQHNGKRNLYYSVNPTRAALSTKAKKTDIAAVEFALADLDPNADETSEDAKKLYLDQFNGGGFEPKPTAAIDSGNGIQALWKLETAIALGKPIADKSTPEDQNTIDDVEARVKAVMLRLGSKPGTQNIDRILRLPVPSICRMRRRRRKGGCSARPSFYGSMMLLTRSMPSRRKRRQSRERANRRLPATPNPSRTD